MPSEKLNIAGVGVGGMGTGDVQSVAGENIVALCDVDQDALALQRKTTQGQVELLISARCWMPGRRSTRW